MKKISVRVKSKEAEVKDVETVEVIEEPSIEDSEKDEKNSLILAMEESIKGMKLSKRAFKNIELDMSTGYIRHLVSSYYSIQENRIKMSNQASAIDRETSSIQNNNIMEYFTNQLKQSEANISCFLDVWTDRHPVAKWIKSNTGIGPVISAGIIARFDVTKTKTAGGFWSYIGWCSGGADRKCRRKGQKVDYSPQARTLVWKAGSSFKMQSTRDNCYYGKLYREKKDEYLCRNEEGGFAENARIELEMKNLTEESEMYKTYKEGKLTLAHIDAMALRFASKIFLSHVFDVMYMWEYGEMPPVPFPIAHIDGHVHTLMPRNLSIIVPDLSKKYPDKDWVSMIKNHYKQEIS